MALAGLPLRGRHRAIFGWAAAGGSPESIGKAGRTGKTQPFDNITYPDAGIAEHELGPFDGGLFHIFRNGHARFFLEGPDEMARGHAA